MDNIHNKEKGQIIIILALALIAILGFTGLAIDGSMIYKERRTDQSTADSAALAGAGAAAQSLKNVKPTEFFCGSGIASEATLTALSAAMAAAENSALADEVTLIQAHDDNDFPTGNGVRVKCLTDEFGAYLDVRVMVTTIADTTFAKAVGTNTLKTKVEATARVYPRQPAAYGNAIVSLSNSNLPLGGIDFGGNSTLFINKGGVFSNSEIKAAGSSSITIEGGTATYYSILTDNCSGCIDSDLSANPIHTTKKLPPLNIKVPQCTTDPYGPAKDSGDLAPGNYTSIKAGTNKTLNLVPGLYCIAGDLTANANSTLTATDVTFYITNSGKVDFAGTAEIHLLAATCDPEVCGIPGVHSGLLMYLDPATPHNVTLNGSSENEFKGTVYGETTIFKLNGTAGGSTPAEFNTQIIGQKVYFSGDVNMLMNMASAELYQQPAWVELLK